MTEQPIEVGIVFQQAAFARGPMGLRALLETVHDSGIDFAGTLDHVSFWGGAGFDGLTYATAIAAAHPTLPVRTAVYLLPLRHPVAVARQLSSLALLASGRFTFGVGIGGERRAEVESVGVDPSTRGRRMDEALVVLRDLLDTGVCSFRGEFFELDDVQVLPHPAERIPVLIGGRSDAALRRTARFGDGWLGFAVSPERYANATKLVAEEARTLGRDVDWRHGMVIWCSFGADAERAAARLAFEMESLYRVSYDKFARYCAAGTPEQVAEFVQLYADVGCRSFSLIANPPDSDEAVAGVARVKELLTKGAR